MSTNAQAILKQIDALPPDEQQEVLEALRQSKSISRRKSQTNRRGRGLFAGSGLLEALLAERAKERARE